MRLIEKEECKAKQAEIVDMLKSGKILVYPTDTIYGIGCDATNDAAVKKLRKAKERMDKPFSIIVPSKDWIRKNCKVSTQEKSWISKLPGPYTLILYLKNENAISKSVNPGGKTIGVRMPNHWMLEIVTEFGKPIITPSANVSGKEFMTSKDNLDPKLQSVSSCLLYEGEKKGQPSTIINLTDAKVKPSSKRKVV